ncbi:lactate racemase domain-containing protein [Candidatus Latescibacterota bacterium]
MSEIGNNGIVRRKFFQNSGMALLAGYAFTNEKGLAQAVQSPNSDKYQSVTVNTHDYVGEIEERLDFPKDWQIDVMKLSGENLPPLTPDQIIQRLRSPIGSKQLRDIAAGKKNAVVTFDDISRPTPVHLIAEHVANELNAAGIDDDHILFICAQGSHQSMTHPEAMAKLGPVFTRCPWMSHNIHTNCLDVGRTTWNNRIQVNGFLATADVKVLIGAIRDHPGFGYSGGAKSIIPGMVSLETIKYNHAVIGGIPKGNRVYEGHDNARTGRNHVIDNEMRLDAVEAARLAGIDFSINVVQSGTRKVLGLHCGDVLDAHLEVCRQAINVISWDRAVNDRDYDIVVSNSYPASRYSPIKFGRPREGGTSISVSQSPLGRHMHYLHDSGTWNLEPWWIGNYNPRTAPYRRIILSQYMSKALVINYEDVIIQPSWDKILPILEKEYKSGTKVLVYPYGSIAHAPKKATLYPEDVKKG